VQRTLLSRNSTLGKIISFLFLSIIAFFLQSAVDFEFLLIGCGLLAIVGYVLFFLPETIEFDDNSMYIKKRNGEIVVDLKDIYKIKITQVAFNNTHTWKIKYKLDGIDKSARFYPNNSSGFEEFINRVKLKNPDIQISNWTSTLDFDM
jgi:hypothetical protein